MPQVFINIFMLLFLIYKSCNLLNHAGDSHTIGQFWDLAQKKWEVEKCLTIYCILNNDNINYINFYPVGQWKCHVWSSTHIHMAALAVTEMCKMCVCSLQLLAKDPDWNPTECNFQWIYVSPLSCVSCVPASCVLIWFVPVLVSCHYELSMFQLCLSRYVLITLCILVLSFEFAFVWSTRYSRCFLSMSVMPCLALSWCLIKDYYFEFTSSSPCSCSSLVCAPWQYRAKCCCNIKHSLWIKKRKIRGSAGAILTDITYNNNNQYTISYCIYKMI